jgi:hypothetical protein
VWFVARFGSPRHAPAREEKKKTFKNMYFYYSFYYLYMRLVCYSLSLFLALISAQAGAPAEFKHIIKRRKRN